VDWVFLGVALVVILGGSQLFTNGVEWVGEGFGLSEGMVGSVLAAIGTALPETILPFVAILTGGHAQGKEIGQGAILGAPFMLATLGMVVVGVSTLLSSRGGKRGTDVLAQQGVIRQDLSFFLVMYALALLAGLVDVRALDWALAAGLVVTYGVYVRKHYRAPGEPELEAEAAGEVRPLYARAWVRRMRGLSTGELTLPPAWASTAQTLAGLGLMVAGARVFVSGMETAAKSFGVSSLVLALLIAPVATELPETFNSVIWIRRRKDTLALGNITGAMVFQSSFPVGVGLLFTSWHLTRAGVISAVIALLAAAIVYATLRVRKRISAWLLLLQAAFYVAYVAYVLTRG